MISCLEDAIDVILQDPIPSADQPPAAFMALLDAGCQLAEAEDQMMNAFMLTESVPDLPTVDILTDSRVWVALDEGCNATCHGPIWAANVEEKLNAYSLCSPWVLRSSIPILVLVSADLSGSVVFQQYSL